MNIFHYLKHALFNTDFSKPVLLKTEVFFLIALHTYFWTPEVVLLF